MDERRLKRATVHRCQRELDLPANTVALWLEFGSGLHRIFRSRERTLAVESGCFCIRSKPPNSESSSSRGQAKEIKSREQNPRPPATAIRPSYPVPYPTQSEIQSCLKQVARELGDSSPTPFRVDVLAVHAKPPIYTVVMLSAEKALVRDKIGQILSRSFSMGASSFTLRGDEAAILLEYCQPGSK